MTDIGHEPSLDPPECDDWPCCPVCGAETDELIRRRKGLDIIGCVECIEFIDAWEWAANE